MYLILREDFLSAAKAGAGKTPRVHPITLSDGDFNRLYTYIQQHYGINLSHKKQLITSRLTNMLQQKGFHSFTEYIDEIISGKDPEMVSVMLNKLTTN